ncbi:uncharacterized protein C8orf74 homolog [Cheilinus undulatus]|uniref:uncharacterized protein C8orf74 homolog n=1 Tax=Cheilinus undulatus TaxID=241271 RepID=UPI001BD61099|nr:uncharacterized protein C8orf74 homolog [Cheilinus undulatus]
MDSLTESEMSQIATLQRDEGLQRLSAHFSWPEFCDERCCFHQEFVYDVTMFAAACGFPWCDVIQAALMAKDIFPKLEGLDIPDLLSLLGVALSERLPNVTCVQWHKFTNFLTNTCITRQRLFQAVVGGAVSVSIRQLHLEVQLPPTPCPLAQGTAVTPELQQKIEELKLLRDGSRVSLGDIVVPEGEELSEQGLLSLVRTAVSATQDQMLQSLTQEALLLSDIQHIKLQQASAATGRLHSPVLSNTGQSSSRQEAPTKSVQHRANSRK